LAKHLLLIKASTDDVVIHGAKRTFDYYNAGVEKEPADPGERHVKWPYETERKDGVYDLDDEEKLMSEDYRSMWIRLGLDLDAHDALAGRSGTSLSGYLPGTEKPPRRHGLFRFRHERSPWSAHQGVAG
jgi:hypothetical protein